MMGWTLTCLAWSAIPLGGALSFHGKSRNPGEGKSSEFGIRSALGFAAANAERVPRLDFVPATQRVALV